MPKVADINVANLVLKVASDQVLFVLLAADGSINRQGNGVQGNPDKDLYIGMASNTLFPSLMSHLTDKMLIHMGGYDMPDKKGAPCRLSVLFQFSDGTSNGFVVTYGSESEGPPGEIADFVRAAVEVTGPWYAAQQKMVASSTKKPWWRFW